MRHVISGTIAGLLLAGSTPLVVQADEIQRPKVEAVDIASASVPGVSKAAAVRAARADKHAADIVAELPGRRTHDFGMLGVTWTRGFDDNGMTVQVRVRAKGAWSGWRELDVESDEGEGGRDGTEPLWIGTADGVAVRVMSPTGRRPAGLAVATIDPGTIPSETATASSAFYSTGDASAVTTVADGSPTYTPRPTIISRASWGAARNTYCDSPRTGNETRGVIVHHTAGSNSYSASQSKAIVRAVQAYHMKGRGWCDIGYNFLVDKYGQIFEGRVGGTDRAVRGAHAGNKGVNLYTMGVSMMGTFTSREPYAAQQTSMVKLIGWRLGTTFHPATGTYGVAGYTLNRIAAHRNVVSTACPGQAAYAWMSRTGGLRDRVKAYIANYTSPIKTAFTALGKTRTGPVYIGESGGPDNSMLRAQNLDFYSRSGIGTFYVAGYFRSQYNEVGGRTGVLGSPTANARSTPTTGVQLQTFQKGRIYRVSNGVKADAYALWGAVADKYVELGEAAGVLGAPRIRQTVISGGRQRAYFTGGNITRNGDGSVTVVVY
jgi:uncharacterized protein with LGFP repeats